MTPWQHRVWWRYSTKRDTLWDSLSSGAQVQAQLRRQQQDSARCWGGAGNAMLPSSPEGLVAKVGRNDSLLQARQPCPL